MIFVKRMLGMAAVAAMVGTLSLARVDGHTVNAQEGLNVRTGPGFSYSVIRVLAYGTVVNTVSTSGSWTKIDSPTTGWVYSVYLTNTPHGSTSGSITKAPGGNPYGLPTSSVGFLNLPASGYGFTTYISSYGRWGVPRMINGLISMARYWKNGYPGVTGKYLNFGDISLQYGGYFYPHQTHRNGDAVDMLPINTSGNGAGVVVGGWGYSTYYTQKLVNLHRAVWYVGFILHNNSQISGVQYYPGHDNHVHTQID